MDEETEKFLEECGWVVECWSPLEISLEHENGGRPSRATEEAASIVIDWLKENAVKNDDDDELVRCWDGSHIKFPRNETRQ